MSPAGIERFAAAFSRALRAMGYYDARHPVFAAHRCEAFEALSEALARCAPAPLTLGSAARALVVDERGSLLDTVPAAAVARRLFDCSVVAIRFERSVDEAGLGHLAQVLAESPDRVRAGGGVSAQLEARGAVGIEVIEVDFAAIFAGGEPEVMARIARDPVARAALEKVLRFRDERGSDDDLEIAIGRLEADDALGDFLEDLLDRAAPGVVEDELIGTSGDFLSGDEVADFAARAYFSHQHALEQRSASHEVLAKSADALSHALVRLAPTARFSLLRRIAGGERPESPGEAQAMGRLGRSMNDEAIVATIAAALLEERGDPDVVRAVGGVLRRLRPVEQDRLRLLDAVDQQASGARAPLDGALWLELKARALDRTGLGLLEIDLWSRVEGLRSAATARRRARGSGGWIYAGNEDRAAVAEAEALAELLAEPGRPNDGLFECVRALLETAGTEAHAAIAQLLAVMLGRAAEGPQSATFEARVGELFGAGPGRFFISAALESAQMPPAMYGRLLLLALDGVEQREEEAALRTKLAQLDPEVLRTLAVAEVSDGPPKRARRLVEAALEADPKTGAKVARAALRHPSLEVKEVVLGLLARIPNTETVSVLAQAAGWRNPRHAGKLLGLDGPGDRIGLHRCRLAAIVALGASRSQGALRPLFELLVDVGWIEGREHEELREAAARALRDVNAPEARALLEEAAAHKKKAIREIARRTLAQGAR